MRPAEDFPQANFTFHRPSNMEEEECWNLKVYRDPNGQFSYSCWEMDENELTNIIMTKKIYIYIVGPGMPPISISTVPYTP